MKHLPFDVTPVHLLPYFSKKLGVTLLTKRDDSFLEAGGGSKARMLQYILADVNPDNCDVLLTAGGPCSNFNRACALMCSKLGIKMHLVEYTDNLDEFETSMNYYICNLANIKTTRCNKTDVVDTLNTLRNDYKNKMLKNVYGGGKSLEGIYAYYDAVKELHLQCDKIDHLFVACGTGTTLTGICAGMHKCFPKAKVHAISVARKYDDEIGVLEENMQLLNNYLQTQYDFSNLEYLDNYICGGYAKYNNSLFETIIECISNEGMLVDPTYSGKAFYGMVNEILNNDSYLNKKIIFWNTGAIFNLLSTKK